MKIRLITKDGINDALADPHPTIPHCMILRKWANDIHAPTRAFPVTGADGSTAWRAELSAHDEKNNWPKVEAWLAKRNADGSPYTRERMLEWLKQAREGGCYLALALVHMCRFLGLGAEVAETIKAIQERSRKRQEEQAAETAKRAQQYADADKAAMDKARTDFLAGGQISPSHFERLCAENNIELHPRTVGMIRNRISSIGKDSIYRSGGFVSPAIYTHIRQLVEALTAPKEEPDPIVESLFRPGGTTTTTTFTEVPIPKEPAPC